ncbi:IS3 family transposase [Paenibacillus vulneris]|uniref:IS3 family transposase n=1 Tax=Paenibacillus vulneris TaxID=1133364 RepID=A0ABW3UZ58_9BACL
MELIAGEESTYGYRKLTVCLKRQFGLIINKKKVYRRRPGNRDNRI